MAHRAQLEFAHNVATHLFQGDWRGKKILEIGSADVNGTIRPFFQDSEYIGVDISAGKGVDLVGYGDKIDLGNLHFDLTISCECFEHNPQWIETFLNMHRMTKNNGFLVFSCASRGRPEHGTTRTSPLQSPGTQSVGWNYYRNLNKKDFVEALDLQSLFRWHFFRYNPKSRDLYFIGSKGGTKLEILDIEALKKSISNIDKFKPTLANIKKAIFPGVWRSIKFFPVSLALYFPDHIFQNYRFKYLQLFEWGSKKRGLTRDDIDNSP
jgi:SAM-dependent methyltransferase